MKNGAAAAVDTRRVRLADEELHCEIAGTGEPLLLIHGLGSCGDDWQPQVDHFRDRYRVVTCDLRGHGRSSKPRGPYSIEGFAGDVASLLRALKSGPTHVVGISLGGMVAFQLAVDAPELIRSLAIVNSGPAVPAATFKQRLPLYVRLAYAHLLGLRRMAAMIAKRLFPRPEQEQLRRAFVARLAANDKGCYLASLRAIFAGWSVADRLQEIRCPVLVLAADQDYTPLAAKQAYAARLPHARLVVIPDSHHALPMEKPREFNEALAAFLAPLARVGVGGQPMQAALQVGDAR
jgi:pimeloyl-ACP methyl ester carboxylesterase